MTARTKMDPIATEVAAGLARAGIAFSPTYNGGLLVALPGGFGEFEIEALYDSAHGDSICSIVGYRDWHSHDDPLQLVLDVFSGKCLLIEQCSDGGILQRKYVLYDFAEFLERVPQGANYKVFNATKEELDRRSRPSVQYTSVEEFSDVASSSSHPVREPTHLHGAKRLFSALVLVLVVLLTLLAIYLSIR